MNKQDLKESVCEEFCALIAGVGVDYAMELAGRFSRHAKQNNILNYDQKILLIGFTFMNWAIANGVWSNLNNTKLRRDLMVSSQRAMTLKVARKIKEGERTEAIAFFAVQIDEEFQIFIHTYFERIKELDQQGCPPDSNVSILISLEWIKEKLNLDDSDMDLIIPTFIEQLKDIDKIISIAMSLNNAEETRMRKGVIKRFLEGFRKSRI